MEPKTPSDTPDALLDTVRSIRRLLLFLVLLVLGVIFYFAKDILMPVALGLLIALTLSPLVRIMNRRGVPALIAAVLVVTSVGGVIGVGGYALSEPLAALFDSIPDMGERIKAKLLPYQQSVDALTDATDQMADIASGGSQEETQRVVVEQPGLITSAATSVASGLTSIFLALLLALFLLASGSMFSEKVVAVMPVLSEKKRALRIVHDVERSVSRYLLTITSINIGLGITVGTLLWWIDMPNAMVWGVLTMILNFLPFVGALAGVALLTLVSFALFDTLGASLLPPALYLACSVIEGNFVTPAVVGRQLSVNIVAVVLSVALWGWLWGMAGALMAVPILLVIKVLCDHVASWQMLGEFVSGRQ